MRTELYERLSQKLPLSIEDINVIVKSKDEETDYKISKNIIGILRPHEEEAKLLEKEGRKIFLRKYTLKDRINEVTYRLMSNLNLCFILRVEGNEIEIEDIECPPCEKDAFSKIPEKYYLLDNGRVVEEIKERVYRVYTCRLKPPK